MSYAGLGIVEGGAGEPYWGYVAKKGEVYFFQANINNVEMQKPKDALLFVRAIAKNFNLDLDVRAVTIFRTGPNQFMINVIMTSPCQDMLGCLVAGIPDDAQKIANYVMNDPDLRALFPSMTVTSPSLWELTDPQTAIKHWLNQPILWDHENGPTDTFAVPAEFSIVLGTADDGSLAKPWKEGAVPLLPGQTSPGEPVGDEKASTNVVLLLVLGGAAYLLLNDRKGKRR